MINKELFVKMICLVESFSEEVDKWCDFGIDLIEKPIHDIPWAMFDCWVSGNFNEQGRDWIDWYLWERIDMFTKEILPYYDEDNRPHYINDAEDLWNLVSKYTLDPCKPCNLKKFK